ncbi:hypothetical protein OSB04_018111 [Centaurea solstitialis]|uniref:Uncharacterized protein n=1 Tax=Centaurea solstitialis TaxID=347529 RepID=A0AA38TF37_9ASTR|nr:hypothetical protein OSB04_018111 [Centaurea solstitialis]
MVVVVSERETETLNRARQLVFSNDNLLPQLPHQLGGQPVVQGGFHHHHHQHHQPSCNMASTIYPTRLFSGNSPAILPQGPPSQPAPPHMYASPGSRLNVPYSSQYPPPPSHDYFVGHVCSNNQPFSLQSNNGSTAPPGDTSTTTTTSTTTNYTCIGAPVGQSFPLGGGSGGGGGREMSPSPINRYHQDGF